MYLIDFRLEPLNFKDKKGCYFVPKFLSILIAIFTILFCSAFPSLGQAAAEIDQPNILINVPSRILILYSKDKVIKKYSVGIGRIDNQTPIGRFEIISKEINPTWIKPTKEGEEAVVIESGPANPLGYRWLEFDGVYGIHGTNQPDSIGRYVSNGCVRMRESDVEELYDMIPLKTPVTITYERLLIRQKQDKNVVLSIYPDAYHQASINGYTINQQLKKYGVAGFLTNEELAAAIKNSTGEEIVVGLPYSLNVIGKKIEEYGVVKNGVYYLPVIPIATELKMAITWDANTALLTSPHGSVPGYVKNDILYLNADDTYHLYQLYAKWNADSSAMYLDVVED